MLRQTSELQSGVLESLIQKIDLLVEKIDSIVQPVTTARKPVKRILSPLATAAAHSSSAVQSPISLLTPSITHSDVLDEEVDSILSEMERQTDSEFDSASNCNSYSHFPSESCWASPPTLPTPSHIARNKIMPSSIPSSTIPAATAGMIPQKMPPST